MKYKGLGKRCNRPDCLYWKDYLPDHCSYVWKNVCTGDKNCRAYELDNYKGKDKLKYELD